jgi:putative CocE/NonD family hydrolase
MTRTQRLLLATLLALGTLLSSAAWLPLDHAAPQNVGFNVKANYLKSEYQIPMRDGTKLFTVVYAPKETAQRYPFLIQRTPYSAGPYGAEVYKGSLGPAPAFAQEGYIFVYQDVRGTFLSEGDFDDVRPYLPNKKTAQEIDEASDTYDTVEWLLKNIPNHNGRAGFYGISYPGFYATMAILAGHPAIQAVSPQAPVTDVFMGDDDHHNGAFFQFESFNFVTFFGLPRLGPTPNQFKNFNVGTPDGYNFFLSQGTLANLKEKYLQNQNKYWNDIFAHGNYDEFWQARTPLPHLKNTLTRPGKAAGPAVMTVGGWFDAEDLYGPLHVYQALEQGNPGAHNTLVMGPWSHGGWARGPGDTLGNIRFEVKTGEWYRDQLELPFFNFYLKDKGEFKQADKGADVWAFRTGSNEWKNFAQWPPQETQAKSLYFQAGGNLGFNAPGETREAFDEYVSDPQKPVPYSAQISSNRNAGYMIEDQRFAAVRPDVLVYQTTPLTEDLTLAGPITANLFVSTTGTDADFVVKVIDVYPDNAPNAATAGGQVKLGGFQMLVRAEIMRGKFRNSFVKPAPFVPNQPAEVKFTLQDLQHTFKAGHKLMVQVQSSWFPLVDRNPQKFVDIYHADLADFQKATHRLYRYGKLASRLQVGVLK